MRQEAGVADWGWIQFGVCVGVLLLGFAVAAVGQAPSISGLSVASGPVGTSVTITGANFGATQGLTSTVTFDGVVAAGRGRPASSWSNTTITVLVPGGATTGNVVVIVGGVASNGLNFAVIPVIQSISPSSGLSGTVVTVTGSGFGSTQAQGPSTVTFNGLAATPSTWGSTSFTVPAPGGVSAGDVAVTVGGQVSNGALFTPTPVIGSVSPPSGAAGTAVTISGSNFGTTPGAVSFNGVAAGSITNWSDVSITATVPDSAMTGNVVVAVNGVGSNGVTFTVTPTISGLSPNPVLANELVTITGGNFGTTASAGTVSFNGIAATPTSWGNSSITVPVPGNATAGNVVVTVNGAASNGMAYTLVPPYSFSVTYAPNGNALTASDSVNGNWSYSYDEFNRLATANNSSPVQGFSYTYDQYGNRWQQNLTAGTGGQSLLTFSGSQTASSNGSCYHAAGLTNQPDGYCFDAAGNLLSDGSHTYSYDAENRIVSVDNGQTATYSYDGSGQRVRKVSGVQTVDYLYDTGGHVLTELNTFGGWNRTEIYAGGRHLATYTNGTTYFAQSDWLGSERVHTLPTGAPSEICSSLPFGDGLNCTGSMDASPKHFTGKERDAESGLDYFEARYYESAMGRFMTADPVGGHRNDPQTLNKYNYVGNNPITLTDPTGLDFYLLCKGNSDTCQGGHAGTTMIDANGKKTFTPTIVTSASLQDPKSGNTATVNETGVLVTTGGQTYQGIFINNTPPADIQGSGKLVDFSFHIDSSDEKKGTLSAGEFKFNGDRDQTRDTLDKRGSYRSLMDRRFLFGKSADELKYHPNSTQHRFGTGPSPHLSVPDNPKNAVPTRGGFHVDRDAAGMKHLVCATTGAGCN